MRRLPAICAAALAVLLSATSHAAIIEPGQVGPNFLKDELVNQNFGPIWTLYNQTQKVTVVFPLGYN
jgi:hypothetical protein